MANGNNVLVYVEKRLILPIAVKLVGSSLSTKTGESTQAGFNWFVAAQFGHEGETGSQTNMADLFPEDVLNVSYPEIERRNLTVREYAELASTRAINPADVVSIEGVLTFPDLSLKSYDAFRPPAIDIPQTYDVYGFKCFTGVLESDGFRVPAYFLVESAGVVCYADEKPVELVGVIKWSPTYESAGHALNSIIVVAAMLLRR